MSRRRRQSDFSPSLFPFLAVLLCTLGALILMLILTVSNAGTIAKQIVADSKTEEDIELEDQLHVVVDQLRSERTKANELVEDLRQKLQHFESHIETLTDELEKLERQEAAVRDQSVLTDQQRKAREEELERLKQQRDELEKAIEKKKTDEANKPPAFAILPYQGTNGTTRRPIYLECTAEGLVIQPEGILLNIRDLAPPHGPGNPLDAALRAIRAHYQEVDARISSYSSPYPLLIVRPSGIKTFALARSAMAGWDDQFGYELVARDMVLTFPESAPGLKPVIEKSLVNARQRQTALIAALPRQVFDPNQLDDLISRPIGGSQLGGAEGSSKRGTPIEDPENWKVINELPEGSEITIADSGGPVSDVPFGQSSKGGSGRNGLQGSNPGDPSGTGSDNPLLNSQLAQSMANDMKNGQFVAGSGGGLRGNSSSPSGPAGQNGQEGLANGSMPGQPGEATGNPGASGGGFQSAAANGTNGDRNQNSAGATGGGSAVNSGMTAQQNNAQNDPTQPYAPNSDQMRDPPSLNYTFTPQQNQNQSQNQDSQLKPISVSQGKDWATSRSEGKATAITRTINMVVLPDAWVLISDNNRSEAEATMKLAEGTLAGSQQLSRLIRKRVEDWGVAVAGGYWKPRLTIETPSEDLPSLKVLMRLLEGSGMDVDVVPLQAAIPKNVKR